MPSATPLPARIGRFCITRELGRGTLGCVYLAHDPVIGRDVAIKTFNPGSSLLERQRYEQHFVNEARAAGRLSHPHIVTVYDVFSEGGAVHIALEYLEGRELSQLLDGGHHFEPDDVASIAWRIADALDHAHQRKVIHRDIKPANIFMLEDNHPKLVDFGIARAPNRLLITAAEGGNPQTIMEACGLLGTPNYMSPEQALGKPVDARTDLYSLGAVIYEMLTGRKPFTAENAEKLVQQLASKAPPALHELDARIPLALSHIVMKAMSKSPDKRYQSAQQMALDLKRYLRRERRRRRRLTLSMPMLEDPGTTSAEPRIFRLLVWTAAVTFAVAALFTLWKMLR
jgi:serine/threonine-protein kinase